MTSAPPPNPNEPIQVHVDADLQDLIPDYLEHRRADVRTIGDAIGREDYRTIQTLGHRMKGEGAGYGFDVISVIGADLEQAAQKGYAHEIRAHLSSLEDFLGRVTVVYD